MAKKQSVGLCLIAKDEEKNVRRLLESVVGDVDVVYLTDTGSTDKTIEIAEAVCRSANVPLEVSHYEWNDDFAAARNYNFSQAKTDWILWLDLDDTWEKKIKISFDQYLGYFADRGITAISLPYVYMSDSADNKVVEHAKPRILKNGVYKWVARVHETVDLLPGMKGKAAYNEEIIIKHQKNPADYAKSLERNLRILLLSEKEEGDKPDPRTVFLLGREFHTAGDFKSSEERLLKYLTLSNYGGDRVAASALLCSIYESRGDFDKQEQYAFEAVRSMPSNPIPYLLVASSFLNKGDWQKAIDWVQIALTKDLDASTGIIQTPKEVAQKSSLILAEAYARLENFEKASAVLSKYASMATEEERELLQEEMAQYQVENTAKKTLDAFTVMSNVVLGQANLGGAKKLIEMLPASLRDTSKQVLTLKRLIGLKRDVAPNTVTIFCGESSEEWDELTVKEKGAGGSETAVVEQAKRFAKMGYKVEVYNGVQTERSYGNVKYIPYEEINWADSFDIFFGWRNPLLFEYINFKANKSYLWMHDVPVPQHFTQKVLDRVDKVILLSNFHASLLPAVPDEKKYITSNGIDLEAINTVTGVVRNPKRVIYASSPDRGLDILLDMWADVKKEIPDAELVWAYGWNTFDALRSGNPELMKWKDEMNKKMDELGVIQLGRLNKEDLYKAYKSAAIWAYPTKFDEINCIVAQEAQASGCYPITTGHAALKEVQIEGARFDDPQKFKEHLIYRLSGTYFGVTDEVKTRSVDEFSWDVTAKNWANDLLRGVEIETIDPLVTVVCVTIRPGMMRVLKDTLDAQTYKNFEVIIIDGRYHERKKEVAKFFKKSPYKVRHYPDPERDAKYPYGLFHADNASLYLAKGELMIFLQDFILIEPDGIQKYVDLYRTHPDAIYTGVDTRNAISSKHASDSALIDVFEGEEYQVGEVEFTSPRIRIGGAIRTSYDPFEWELNWAAAPRGVLLRLGGWNPEWDLGFGYDNTEIALRHIYGGGKVIVDETNIATALSHWQLFPADNKGVPHRDKAPNDKRFQAYLNYLNTTSDAQVKLKLEAPIFIKEK